MELLSIAQIRKRSGIPETSIRRYLLLFKKYLPEGLKLGRATKYPPAIVQHIKDIYTWYQHGKSQIEIEEKLQSGEPVSTTTPLPRHDKFEELSQDIRNLTDAIKFQTEAFAKFTAIVSATQPPQNQIMDCLTSIQQKLLSISTTTQLLSQSNTPTNNQIIEKTKSPPTGELQNDIKIQEPYIKENSIDIIQQSNTPHHQATKTTKKTPQKRISSHNTITTDKKTVAAIPDWQEQDAYKTYTFNLILNLQKKGLSHRKIVEELLRMGVKTRTGKDKWSVGTIGNILLKEK